MKLKGFSLIFILVVFMVGCKSTQHDHINSEKYVSNYKTVVLTNFGLPDGLNNRADIREHYKKEVIKIFEAKNIHVLDEELYFDEFDKQKKLVGGYIDKFTGKADKQKRTSVRNSTLNALNKNNGVDSVIFYDIRVKTAYFGDYRAEWDGQSETYELNNSDVANFLSTLIFETDGKIPALSFLIFLEDIEGNELYHGAGGIELIAKLNDNNEFEYIPVERLLKNREKINFSVQQAFKEFLSDRKKRDH